jgi:hypothetical protein
MSSWVWAGLVVIVLLFILRNSFGASIPRLVREAAETQDLGPLIATLSKRRNSVQPTAYNQAIRQLWEMDERSLALELVKELASRHGRAKIAQYWLREALTTEPAIARKVFTRAFLTEHYQPEVAAQCGPVG